MPTLPKLKNNYDKNQQPHLAAIKSFHIGSITPIKSKKNSLMFCQVLEAMCELGFRVSIIAEGSKETQNFCFNLLEKYPDQFQILESIEKNKQKITKNTDTLIFIEQPSKEVLAQVVNNNIVSILPENSGLQNFNLKDESGESFTFRPGSIWSLVSAIIRANENFKFPYDWQTIKRNLSLLVF